MKKSIITIVLILMLSLALPQALAWQIERPHDDINLRQHVQNSNTDGYASVGKEVANVKVSKFQLVILAMKVSK